MFTVGAIMKNLVSSSYQLAVSGDGGAMSSLSETSAIKLVSKIILKKARSFLRITPKGHYPNCQSEIQIIISHHRVVIHIEVTLTNSSPLPEPEPLPISSSLLPSRALCKSNPRSPAVTFFPFVCVGITVAVDDKPWAAKEN